MLELGFLDEVKVLKSCGLEDNPSASQAIGYRHCLEYINSPQTGEDYEQLVHNFKTASRHYIKRQFTWFKKEKLFKWLNIEDYDLETACGIIKNEFESRLD